MTPLPTKPKPGASPGVYSNYDNVLSLVAKLKQQFGQPVYVVVSNQNGRQLYKVVVGAYANINEASIMQSRLAQAWISVYLRKLHLHLCFHGQSFPMEPGNPLMILVSQKFLMTKLTWVQAFAWLTNLIPSVVADSDDSIPTARYLHWSPH